MTKTKIMSLTLLMKRNSTILTKLTLLVAITILLLTVGCNSSPELFQIDPGWYDIMIFHPKTKFENNRPDWVFRNNRNKVNINLKDVEIEKPFLVMAIKSDEDYQNSVAFDIVEVNANVESITLALEKGNYNVIFQNQQNQAKLKTITVD